MRAAAGREAPDPPGIRQLARLAFCDLQVLAGDRPPRDVGRAGASPAIDAMTIDQCMWSTLQHVPCPATNASTREFHKTHLAECNRELARLNTSLGGAQLCPAYVRT